MPLGLNRTDLNTTQTTYANGNPVLVPKNFGTVINIPKNFGNPVTTPINFGSIVNWVITSDHFGNIIGTTTPPGAFSLEDGTGKIALEAGGVLLQER